MDTLKIPPSTTTNLNTTDDDDDDDDKKVHFTFSPSELEEIQQKLNTDKM